MLREAWPGLLLTTLQQSWRELVSMATSARLSSSSSLLCWEDEGGAQGHIACAKLASAPRNIGTSGTEELWKVECADKGGGAGKAQPPFCTPPQGTWPPHTSRAARLAFPAAEGAWQGQLAAGDQKAPMQETAPSFP